MKKYIFIIIAFSCAIIGCGKNEWPSNQTAAFIQSCLANGGENKACQCTLDKLQGKYSYTEFEKIPVDKIYPLVAKLATDFK